MKREHRSMRRFVLRAVSAAGCSAWWPIAISADTGKTGAAATKVSQASVRYRATPNGDQKCATCTNFIADSKACRLVQGTISPEGWCTLWTKKG